MNALQLVSAHTCGPACWEAREDICRCECGGANHGCLRSASGIQPVRRTKIQGEGYSLDAVGRFYELEQQAVSRNDAVGCTYRYAYQPHAKYCEPVARIKQATDAQIDVWPELAAYRAPESRILGVYLLWAKDEIKETTEAAISAVAAWF